MKSVVCSHFHILTHNERMRMRITLANDGHSFSSPPRNEKNSSASFIPTDFKYQYTTIYFSLRMDELPIHERNVNNTYTFLDHIHLHMLTFSKRKRRGKGDEFSFF